MKRSLSAMLLAMALAGCVTVPTLQEPPETIAGRVSSDVVAYNEAYGSAIADQILLNVLRARDRQPLYYLSMSGITEQSYNDTIGEATIGSIGLGHGNPNWGVGQVRGARSNRTQPVFSLNPFGAGKDVRGGSLQFLPASTLMFRHYWNADWPRDLLLYVMVDKITVVTGAARATFSNSSSASHSCLRAGANTPLCNFADVVVLLADRVTDAAIVECQGSTSDGCGAEIRVRQPQELRNRRYRLQLRALDDMIYYLGSIQRTDAARPLVRPPGVYAMDPQGPNISARQRQAVLRREWDSIRRSATLFAVSPAPADYQPGSHAAEVTYLGHRYVAGPVNSLHCEVQSDGDCADARRSGDASATVLSLLTQLTIVNQSEAAQLAPQWGGPPPSSSPH